MSTSATNLFAPPVVILVRPQLGENIGAAARAMMNCGLHDLRLVAPRDGWPNPAALPMAAGGAEIIEIATVYDDVGAAAHDLTFLAALSARRSLDRCPVFLLVPVARTVAEAARI